MYALILFWNTVKDFNAIFARSQHIRGGRDCPLSVRPD
jgi:hypothetical protein